MMRRTGIAAATRLALGAVALLLATCSQSWPARTSAAPATSPRAYLPAITAPAPTPTPPALPTEARARVNAYRGAAGLQPITYDPTLDSNCVAHSHYMTVTGTITHQEDPNHPAYTPAGQICAGKGNLWFGIQPTGATWTPADSVDSWMRSPAHRLWLLYPTTSTMGYGFDTQPGAYAAAALDVLSGFQPSGDGTYSGWPVRYPADGQTGIPAVDYPVTLHWPYFGSSPTLGSATLRTGAGALIPSSATTSIPAGHKGVLITPASALPAATRIVVSVSGAYGGVPFSYTWSFTTR